MGGGGEGFGGGEEEVRLFGEEMGRVLSAIVGLGCGNWFGGLVGGDVVGMMRVVGCGHGIVISSSSRSRSGSAVLAAMRRV